MLWAVRGTLRDTQQDITIVVEAETRDEAEYMGVRRGIPVVVVEEATAYDISTARQNKLLWRYTPESKWTAFGRPVFKFELATLVACALATIALLLRVAHVPFLHMS